MTKARQWLAVAAVAFLAALGGYVAAGKHIAYLVHPPDAVLPDGGRYAGEVRDGRFHGRGTITWPDGNRYEGQFVDGQYEGEGRSESPYGAYYEGEFQDGMRHGEGVARSRYGDTYEGTWREGEIVRGVYRGPNGEKYAGSFENFMFQGRGEFTDADGNVYRGTFEKGVLEGEGVHESVSGRRYEGEFENHRYHGEGTVTWPDGTKFVGTFHEGLRNGPGRTYAPSGELIREGVWLQGALVAGGNPESDSETRGIERAVYRQHALMDQAIEGVQRGEPGRVELYFVGFAPYGGQDVFRKEIEFVADQVARRFGATERTVILGNHPDTLDSRPLATRTSLKRTLRRLTKRMNPEEDILFLYLTSHGSPDASLAVEQPGLRLPDLGAEDLARIVNELPNRWKVIGISACYSGGFIEHLRSERALVMTSARADRTSFGCGDDSEMTYFGKAYFRDSLPEAPSLVAAFENASALIHEWEEEEDLPRHSEPQMAAGEAIVAYLAQWRRSRSTAAQ